MTTQCYLSKVVGELQHSQRKMRARVQVRGFSFGSEDFSSHLKHTVFKDYNGYKNNQRVSLKAAMSVSIWSSLKPSDFRQLTYLEMTYKSLKAGERLTSEHRTCRTSATCETPCGGSHDFLNVVISPLCNICSFASFSQQTHFLSKSVHVGDHSLKIAEDADVGKLLSISVGI